jgi:trehalose 6-phosphate phosphatase
LKYLSDGVDLNVFFDQVRHADQRILLLDYDGTLAPFVVDRHKAFPYPEAKAAIHDIMALNRSSVVIVSGRAIKDITPLLGLEPSPEIWGSHGWERLLPDGAYSIVSPDELSTAKLALARNYLASLDLLNSIEEKPVSLAVHWRGLTENEAAAIRKKVSAAWSEIIQNSNLEIHPFDGGLEMQVKGRDKGMAVAEILSGVKGNVAAAYLGDDRTDEDAFRMMKSNGLSVLVRPELRETLADVWLTPPAELIDFLSKWKNACMDLP